MKLHPIAHAVAIHCGISSPKARIPILVYVQAGGPFASIKV